MEAAKALEQETPDSDPEALPRLPHPPIQLTTEQWEDIDDEVADYLRSSRTATSSINEASSSPPGAPDENAPS